MEGREAEGREPEGGEAEKFHKHAHAILSLQSLDGHSQYSKCFNIDTVDSESLCVNTFSQMVSATELF